MPQLALANTFWESFDQGLHLETGNDARGSRRRTIDVSEWYDGQWVWLEGVEIGPDDQDGSFRQALVRVAALRPEEDQQGVTDSVTRASP
ncbi:hypothetical protein OG400_25910 [Micromonospora ureilytica]|uniref:hypothetical protein n=1 Tax=Micromonospora ureilytica TaxID=709868 RepID=UPI002E107B65|nr:hypothetical protein OG400_25910 [Micromonospora ureilytica]